jgi:anti-sigma B factor antagonist
MALHFSTEEPVSGDGEPVFIRLNGRMTLGPQLLEFGRSVARVLASQHRKGVLLDMSGVEDVDSAGLGELVILYTTAGQHGSRLCLVKPTPRILRLLETTKLSGILKHFGDTTAATAWLAGAD